MIHRAVTKLPSAVAAGALAALSVLALGDENRSATAQQPAAHRDRADSDPLDLAIREIQQVRKQLQLDPLKGTVLERPSGSDDSPTSGPATTAAQEDTVFVDALRRVVVQQNAGAPQRRQPAVRSADGAPRLPETTAEEPSLVQLLRVTGRRLDNRANDLEDRCEYAAADRLRNLANALRREARLLNRRPTPYHAVGTE